MFKKFLFILFVFALVIAGLQLFGGRDFSQITVAWEKYRYGGTLGELVSDVGSIFAGEKLNQGGLATAKLANRIIYRWTDEHGVVHHSERMPTGYEYETIRMGDVSIDVQKSMDKEEIDSALKGN